MASVSLFAPPAPKHRVCSSSCSASANHPAKYCLYIVSVTLFHNSYIAPQKFFGCVWSVG